MSDGKDKPAIFYVNFFNGQYFKKGCSNVVCILKTLIKIFENIQTRIRLQFPTMPQIFPLRNLNRTWNEPHQFFVICFHNLSFLRGNIPCAVSPMLLAPSPLPWYSENVEIVDYKRQLISTLSNIQLQRQVALTIGVPEININMPAGAVPVFVYIC